MQNQLNSNEDSTHQVSLDPELVEALKTNAGAQSLGFAEFVHRAVRFYLRLHEEMKIRRQYQSGYGSADLTELAPEMKDWQNEQEWPEP
jgi:hypothetical protein